MWYGKSLAFLVLMTAVAAVLGGCGSQPSKDRSHGVQPAAGGDDKTAQPGKDAGEGMSASAAAEPPAGLAELDEADRAAAAKQRVCPVTGELLGSMGKPYKVVVKGQTVFLCCPGCEEAIKNDPDKYLAKLKAAEGK